MNLIKKKGKVVALENEITTRKLGTVFLFH